MKRELHLTTPEQSEVEQVEEAEASVPVAQGKTSLRHLGVLARVDDLVKTSA